MNLQGRIPVEPLSDERMTNIERSVVAGAADAAATRSQSNARRWFAFAAVAAVAAAVGVIGMRFATTAPGAPTVAVAEPIRVNTMDKLAKLDIGDATIVSDPATVFVVTRPDGGVLVDMTRGKVELEVGKRGNRAPLVVRAGKTEVVVVGTHFSVDYGDGTGDVDVRVTEGVVKVVHDKIEARVAAGRAWETKRGAIALADATPKRGVAVASSDPANGTASASDIDIDVGAQPDVNLHGRTSHAPDANHVDTGGSASVPRKPGAGAGSAKSPIKDLRKALYGIAIQPAFDIGLDDYKQAVAKHYETIRNNARGAEASRAMYSIAVIQWSKLRDSSAALRTLRDYIGRFEDKNEHAAALWLRVRILCEKNADSFDDSCRQAASMYVREVPNGAPSGIAERIWLSPE